MNRRRPDIAGVVFGAIFVAAAIWWVLDHSFALNLPRAGWIIAVVLIVLGVLGLVSVLRGDRRRDRRRRRGSGSYGSKP
jgi:hydrogenase/urease accessory protein HupE